MSDNKFWAVFWTLCTVLALAFMAASLYTCDRSDDRREKCVERGRSPAECRQLFSDTGDCR